MKRTILITGAGTGIGRDSAFALAMRGHSVLATTQTEEQARALREEAAQKNAVLQVFKLDITQDQDRQSIADLSLDVLINNAGVGESGSLAEVGIERIRQVFEVNVFSTLALTQIALRGMIARQRGTVLFVSSIAGRLPMPFLMPYGMSKFALSAGGAALREEIDQLGKNVHIALIEPGAIFTGFNQAMMARKYTWMGPSSYFAGHVEKIKRQEGQVFKWLEASSTDSIVRQIVKATEAKRPKLRYVAPWLQGFGVRLARILGV